MVEDATSDGDSDEVVVPGGETAAALAAERSRVPTGPAPIAGVDHPAGSGDMWRRVERSEDAAMSAFVGGRGSPGLRTPGETTQRHQPPSGASPEFTADAVYQMAHWLHAV